METGTFRSNWLLPSKVNNTQMLTRFTSIHLAWHAFRRMAPLGIQHNISTIFCLCVSFGSIFLLCCGCFGKCFFSLLAQFLSLRSTKVLIFLLNSFCFATHYITLVESPRSTQFLQFRRLRWWNWQTDSFYTRSFSLRQITFRREIIFIFGWNLTELEEHF